jgi:guanine nucleotide-binding protein G(I)/G(S)/G(T) subunit beta-1
MFAGYDDNSCHIFDTALGTDIQSVSHDYRISSLGLNCEGKALATGSWDSTLKVFA